jgi:hypothetical protein
MEDIVDILRPFRIEVRSYEKTVCVCVCVWNFIIIFCIVNTIPDSNRIFGNILRMYWHLESK